MRIGGRTFSSNRSGSSITIAASACMHTCSLSHACWVSSATSVRPIRPALRPALTYACIPEYEPDVMLRVSASLVAAPRQRLDAVAESCESCEAWSAASDSCPTVNREVRWPSAATAASASRPCDDDPATGVAEDARPAVSMLVAERLRRWRTGSCCFRMPSKMCGTYSEIHMLEISWRPGLVGFVRVHAQRAKTRMMRKASYLEHGIVLDVGHGRLVALDALRRNRCWQVLEAARDGGPDPSQNTVFRHTHIERERCNIRTWRGRCRRPFPESTAPPSSLAEACAPR